MAEYIVPNGQTESDLDLEAQDVLKVQGGGTAKQCTALTGGQIIGYADAKVEKCTVSGLIPPGMTELSSGMIDLKGGAGKGNTVMAGGAEHVSSGGIETNGKIYGLLRVSKSGSAASPVIYNGGVAEVLGGGCIGEAVVEGGGIMRLTGITGVPGTADSRGQADSATIRENGLLEVLSGGYSFSACVSGRITVAEHASANYTTVSSGGQMVVSSGGRICYAWILAGAQMTVKDGGITASSTIINGGIMQAENLILNGPEKVGSPGGYLPVLNGGQVSAAAMTVESGARVQIFAGGQVSATAATIRPDGRISLDSTSILRFRTLDKQTGGTFEVADLESYNPQTGTCRRLLDCTAETPWTEQNYKDLLGVDPAVFSSAFVYGGGDLYLQGQAFVSAGGDGDESFATVGSALALNPNRLVLMDGTFAKDSNAPTFNGVETVISGGNFTTSVCGGVLVSASTETTDIGASGAKKNISMVISGGTFEKNVFAGDRVNAATYLTRTGDISMTIEGGTFRKAVAGGLAFTISEIQGTEAMLEGSVFLTIKGGTFQDTEDLNKEWIYGGCIASKKTFCAQTVITGDVTVTLDSSDRALNIVNLVAGSYGDGRVEGDVTLVVTGSSNNTITATGEIWGGCSGDYYTADGKYETHVKTGEGPGAVLGRRTLSFTGFQGELLCNKIRAFNYAEFVKDGGTATTAKLNDSSGSGLNMRYVENWTFENGCSLTGNFANNFTGDTLRLTGLDAGLSSVDWTILTDSNDTAYKGFGSFGSVSFGTDAASYNSVKDVWYNDDYVLYRSENSMLLTTHDSYVTRFGAIA